MRLILFDFDGTLVDSQAHIVGSMEAAFTSQGLTPPTQAETLSIVGLSLPRAMAVLSPEGPTDDLVAAYKQAYGDLRTSHGERSASPLYPGIMDLLRALHAEPETLLGLATGKSRRGLDHVLEVHDIARYFVTRQDADGHPSKPHPSMATTALAEAGCERGVMVGDTTFDMDMGRAAGMATLGVAWGYHPVTRLAEHADVVVQEVPAIHEALNEICPETLT
ncbi:MAG: HAD-IA family hydrolase [Rhodobacteraceae bacterium]|nr:HAD-IA family hydrolase [Paracoccaceae bacterium]